MTNNELKRFDFDKVLIDKGYFNEGECTNYGEKVIIETEKWRDMFKFLMSRCLLVDDKIQRTKIIEPRMIYEYLVGMGDV